MSKSKGNVVDPLVMIEEHGADAVRGWAAAVGTGGQDVRFNEERIRSYKRFANKIWNATRFLVARLDDGDGRMAASVDAPGDRRAPPRGPLDAVAGGRHRGGGGRVAARLPLPRRHGASLRRHLALVLRLVRRDDQAAAPRRRSGRVAARRRAHRGGQPRRAAAPAAPVHALHHRGVRAAAPGRRPPRCSCATGRRCSPAGARGWSAHIAPPSTSCSSSSSACARCATRAACPGRSAIASR